MTQRRLRDVQKEQTVIALREARQRRKQEIEKEQTLRDVRYRTLHTNVYLAGLCIETAHYELGEFPSASYTDLLCDNFTWSVAECKRYACDYLSAKAKGYRYTPHELVMYNEIWNSTLQRYNGVELIHTGCDCEQCHRIELSTDE